VQLAVRLLRFKGIPVRIHATFGLLLAFLVWRAGTASDIRVAAFQSLLVVLLFLCVALHEVGHAAAALRHDIPITAITLYPFGGVAKLERRPQRGREEILIALAGPAVNLALAGLLVVATRGQIFGGRGGVLLEIAQWLFWGNLAVAGFNLLPAFPLDGGRVLRGALAARIGWSRATVWAASAGQALAVALMVAGVLRQPWLFLAGILIFPGANRELRMALRLRSLHRSSVHEVMVRDIQLVGPDARIDELALASRDAPTSEYLVHDGHQALGFLSAARLWREFGSQERRAETALEASIPLAPPVRADESLAVALESLTNAGREAATVLDDQGRVVGLILRSMIERAESLTRAIADRDRGR
jgi:stage IV sporulation protein FB